MLDYYKSRLDIYGQQLGDQLRAEPSQSQQQGEQKDKKDEKNDKKKDEKKDQKQPPKGEAGPKTLKVIGGFGNSSMVPKILAEVTLRVVDYYKARIELINGALKSMTEDPALSQSGAALYTLYILNGVPEAVLIDSSAKDRQMFVFAGRFRVKQLNPSA